MKLKRDELLMKLGAAAASSRPAWRLVDVQVHAQSPTFTYRLERRQAATSAPPRRPLPAANQSTGSDPAKLWRYYIQLAQVEEAFKNLKGDLAIRPIYHQNQDRIEAHIFIAFLAYCLHVTLGPAIAGACARADPASVLEKFAAVQMIDVQFPTTDGRERSC